MRTYVLLTARKSSVDQYGEIVRYDCSQIWHTFPYVIAVLYTITGLAMNIQLRGLLVSGDEYSSEINRDALPVMVTVRNNYTHLSNLIST